MASEVNLGKGRTIHVAVGVAMAALGLLVLVSVVALCGGSKTYETAEVKM